MNVAIKPTPSPRKYYPLIYPNEVMALIGAVNKLIDRLDCLDLQPLGSSAAFEIRKREFEATISVSQVVQKIADQSQAEAEMRHVLNRIDELSQDGLEALSIALLAITADPENTK